MLHNYYILCNILKYYDNSLECYKICIIYFEIGYIDLLYLSNIAVYFNKNSYNYKIVLNSLKKTLFIKYVLYSKMYTTFH